MNVTGQNVDKPKRRQPNHRQTETSTDQNVDKQKYWQTETSTSMGNGPASIHKDPTPIWLKCQQIETSTKTSTDQNVDKRGIYCIHFS